MSCTARTVGLLVAAAATALCAASATTATPLHVGSTVSGQTSEDGSQLLIDDCPPSPQSIYSFTVPSTAGGEQSEADVRFTTCVPVGDAANGYDLASSTLHVVDVSGGEPEGGSRATSVAAGAPDCGGKYATLEFRAPTDAPFLLVVSSAAGRGGRFRLESSVTASPPLPTPLPWGLDRIDQRTLPLDKKYSVTGLSGTKVYVYVLDSGVRVSHSEFVTASGERNAVHGLDAVERLDYATDCTGHGSHVASTIAGRSFGVAKDAIIISVRVIGCDGAGHTSRLLEGLEFVLKDSEARNRRPAVASLSLSTPRSELINRAARQLSEAGIPVVTAAGNRDQDSCDFSPASEPTSITVAASDRDDSRPTFSNSGHCVDLFAPGQDILSAWHTGDHSSRVMSGTSFACPHVTGAIAVLLSVNPALPTSAVANMIFSAATFEKVSNHSSGVRVAAGAAASDVNNRLIYVRPIPSIGLERPARGFMYIYAVLHVSTGTAECSPRWLASDDRLAAAQRHLASMADVAATGESVEAWMCCPGSKDTPRCGKSTSTPRLFVRLREKERLASATFNALDASLTAGRAAAQLQVALRSDQVSIAIEPWVVDSDANVFWAAPDLRGGDGGGPSGGALAALIACSSAVLIATVAVALVCVRRRREKDKFSHYLDSIELHGRERAQHEALQPAGVFDICSPRELRVRENTALQGDILMNLTSTASLRTPRVARGADGPPSVGSVGASPFGTALGGSPFRDPRPQRQATVAPRRGPAAASIVRAGAGEDGLAATPRDARGLPTGGSFFARVFSLTTGGRNTANSPSAQHQSQRERDSSRQALEASRPFRPSTSLAPGALALPASGDLEPPSPRPAAATGAAGGEGGGS